jgi:uncharacterized protein YjiK
MEGVQTLSMQARGNTINEESHEATLGSSLHGGTSSVIQKQVDRQYMVHQVRTATDDVLIHVTHFTGYVLIEGIAYSRKEPVLIESSSRNPISIVKVHESFILNDVAEARRK